MPTSTSPSGFFRFIPGFLLLAGLILGGIGLALNHYHGQQGTLILREGQRLGLALNSEEAEDEEEAEMPEGSSDTLGYYITLDSLTIRPYTPEYRIEVWQNETSEQPQASPMAGQIQGNRIDAFDLKPMEIRKAGESEFRFRMREFYPNFQFAYTYPENRDTIQPLAPGITLELHLPGKEPLIATMLSDNPSRSKLDDVIGLGASISFYWTLPVDTLNALTASTVNSGMQVVFEGEQRKIHFLENGNSREEPLQEQTLYPLPGKDSTGIKVLYCYPDASLLKAVPATIGTELLNPVAAVEYWPVGGRYQEAYIYPESATKKGGAFTLPGTSYKLILGTDLAEARKHCDCQLTFEKQGGATPEKVSLPGGSSHVVDGYRLSPGECRKGYPGTLVLGVAKMPGRPFVMAGLMLMAAGALLYILRRILYISKTANGTV